MSFRSTFVAITIGGSLIVASVIINQARPATAFAGQSASFIRASGKCAECHRAETGAVVHQYEQSAHNQAGVSCLECHGAQQEQEEIDHNGFALTTEVTSLNCQRCHATEYDQYLRSRHAMSAWAAVNGTEGMTPEMIELGERYHPGTVDRPANTLIALEGLGTRQRACQVCHSVGKPNLDGSVGSCVHCHSRHSTSVALAREPRTCGQCHMGPDHSQLEIYSESRHGVLFHAQRESLNLEAEPTQLTTRDMSVPTCATCHMSGLEGQRVTHDTTERLSYFLYAPISQKRPGFEQGQVQMKETCLKCHAKTGVERFYHEAEVVLNSTNEQVAEAKAVMDGLYADGVLTRDPFDEPIEFVYFDFWHYFGRTAKHGAYMGGADFVQWHGSYELLAKMVELKELAREARVAHAGK